MSTRKGFTLIELLVVIAIISVLSIVVILTLNPAELLRQARDSNRISDLGVLKSAISLYLEDVSSPSMTSTCSFSVTTGTPATADGHCNGRYQSSSTINATQSGVFAVDGTGWVPVNFTLITSGAPIGNLPRDPTNTAGAPSSTTSYYYTFRGSSTPLTFEIDAKIESTKYSRGGTSDVESTDGGDNVTLYESGTSLTL